MQFFKHMTNMRFDRKIQRVKNKYGLRGYGLYNHIIESIAESLCTKKPIPDLEDTANDIAIEYGEDTVLINEMMAFMLNQGLFELDEITGRILCHKVYKFLDQSQTRSKEIRQMIDKYKNNNLSLLVSDNPERIEENRIEVDIEENRIEYKNVKDCYNYFLLHLYDQDEINELIFKSNKEIKQHASLIKKLQSDNIDYKQFFDKAFNDKWIKGEGFLPSLLISQYDKIKAKIYLKNNNQNKQDWSINSAK